MSESTRRGFVKASAGAAAGMSVIGALVAETAEGDVPAQHSGSVVAYVRDARTGEISVMSGDREVRVRDKKLAARLAREAQAGQR